MKHVALLVLFSLLTLPCTMVDRVALVAPTAIATSSELPPSTPPPRTPLPRPRRLTQPPTTVPNPTRRLGMPPTASADYSAQRITREATGGKTAGYLFMPAGKTGERFPAVVAIHGGFADSPIVADRATEGVGRNFAARLCPRGFVVFSVDYRWSPFGLAEMEDVAGAFDYLSTRPEVDPKRIAVAGGSHGGYMTMMAVSSPKYKRPFAVAVNLYGFVDVANLVNSPRERNNPQAKLTIEQLGPPAANPTAYREISPRYHIDNLNVPVLIVVGTKDQFLHQLRAFSADLEKAGKDYEYHEVADAPHGFEQGREPYTTTLWNYVITFLETRLK